MIDKIRKIAWKVKAIIDLLRFAQYCVITFRKKDGGTTMRGMLTEENGAPIAEAVEDINIEKARKEEK